MSHKRNTGDEMAAVCTDKSHLRGLDESLHICDEELWYWAKIKRADKPPNGWYTESNTERAIRGPRSTAPTQIPQRFTVIDSAVAKCTELEQKVLVIYYVRYPHNGKDFQRRRLNMSEGKWDRLLRSARATVAGWLLSCDVERAYEA